MYAYVEKVRFLKHNFEKVFRPLQFLSYFYYCFKAAVKTNTIFHYGKKCANRFVDHKYFTNILGTVPTFGFRISIVENVRSQNFIKNWLSEVRKFLLNLVNFWIAHVYKNNFSAIWIGSWIAFLVCTSSMHIYEGHDLVEEWVWYSIPVLRSTVWGI